MLLRKKCQSVAQTMMEYLLLMVIIVGIVFGAFTAKSGGVLNSTREAAEGYFDTGSKAIVGGYYRGGVFYEKERRR